MAKITVFEAAKRLEIEPSEFQKKLRELGINAEDFQATIDTGDLPRVQALMNDEGGEGDKAFTERRVGTTVIRRRARRGQPADEPEEAIETTAAAEEAEESAEASDVSREQPAPPPLVVAEEAPMTEEAPAAAPAPPAAESEDADKVTDSTTMMRRQPAERGGGSRPKVLSLRGRTPEPAKVVARPARPVA
ncbi:hypothetical protein K8I61_01805, partial [bacterium]|nr:hypothetical protein [bacterium]